MLVFLILMRGYNRGRGTKDIVESFVCHLELYGWKCLLFTL